MLIENKLFSLFFLNSKINEGIMNHLGGNQQEIRVFFRVQPQTINLSKGEFETQSHEDAKSRSFL